jgi:hypothetical protein
MALSALLAQVIFLDEKSQRETSLARRSLADADDKSGHFLQKMFTLWPAYAAFEVGKLADFTCSRMTS